MHKWLVPTGYKLTNPGGAFTNNGYPTRIITTVAPPQVALSTGLQAVGDGVFGIGVIGGAQPNGYSGGGLAAHRVQIIPLGTGVATNTFSMKVLGWLPSNLDTNPTKTPPVFIPHELGTWAVTLGTGTGIANAELDTTYLFPTTITMTGGPTFVTSGAAPIIQDWFQTSPGSNSIAFVSVPTFGFWWMETIFTTGGSATGCNALYTQA